MVNAYSIRFKDVWKRYGLPPRQVLKNVFRRLPGAQSGPAKTWALENISFDIEVGETIGIVGANGSGKTTLLRMLAGVTPPTRGSIEVSGRVFPMIELTAGVHGELTGRENAQILAVLVGLSPAQAEKKLESIQDYSGLLSWFDQPIRTYSSGMLARIGFSVAAHVDADTILIDEVLAVGDLTFQRKCIATVENWKKQGKTVLFVSHNIRQLERVCNRTMWLKNGQLKAIGTTSEIVSKYLSESNLSSVDSLHANSDNLAEVDILQDIENPIVIVKKVRFLNELNGAVSTVCTDENLRVTIELEGSEKGTASVSISIITVDGIELAAFDSGQFDHLIEIQGVNAVSCLIAPFPLMPGSYYIAVRVVSLWGQLFGSARISSPLQVGIPQSMKISAHTGLVHLQTTWSTNTGHST